VRNGVYVLNGVLVGIFVEVFVGVFVGEGVSVGVNVGVKVDVGEAVGVDVHGSTDTSSRYQPRNSLNTLSIESNSNLNLTVSVM